MPIPTGLGDGDSGKRELEVETPRGLGELKEDRRGMVPFTAFCKRGLAGLGLMRGTGLARPDKGDPETALRLLTEPEMDGVREYRGGVLKTASGLAAKELAGSPRSFR